MSIGIYMYIRYTTSIIHGVSYIHVVGDKLGTWRR